MSATVCLGARRVRSFRHLLSPFLSVLFENACVVRYACCFTRLCSIHVLWSCQLLQVYIDNIWLQFQLLMHDLRFHNAFFAAKMLNEDDWSNHDTSNGPWFFTGFWFPFKLEVAYAVTCTAIQTQVLEMRSCKMCGASGKRFYHTDREIFRQHAESTYCLVR